LLTGCIELRQGKLKKIQAVIKDFMAASGLRSAELARQVNPSYRKPFSEKKANQSEGFSSLPGPFWRYR
jgi:hypothetical protein